MQFLWAQSLPEDEARLTGSHSSRHIITQPSLQQQPTVQVAAMLSTADIRARATLQAQGWLVHCSQGLEIATFLRSSLNR